MKKSFFNNIFRTLAYRNFRLFFIGQGISLIGTWMQYIAMGWLVYRLTNSALMLGVVVFSSQIPTFLLSPFAGVFADRYDRRSILLITQILAMIQAFILAFLTLTHTIAVWHIIVMGIFLGVINSFDIPARQSFVIEMVERKEALGNAIALNSLMFNMARLVGPSIAGVIVALAGEGVCFLLNGITFLAVIACLMAMKISPKKRKAVYKNVMHGLKEGFNYTFGSTPIKFILILLGTMSLLGASYVVLMPVFARDVFHGGPGTLGFLMAAVGVGALIGTLYLASRRGVLRLGNIIPISSAIFSVGMIFFSFSNNLWVSLAILVTIGFGSMVQMATSNIVLQTIVDDDKRGRVMSFYSMAFMGMMPLGSLIAGYLANNIGAPKTLMISGLLCALASLLFAAKIPHLKKVVHPIYEKIGISPEVAWGMSAATGLTVPPED
ncbi:MAG: MFS transporter [Candidatus Omnitrophica bacterium]|nr:MFS transporter [Candidatus Omnitrophota bacterium]MBU4487441.1 MFS transporter [Candidatus Omnitrophota bacterium]MCG2705077.1 MFS transporter [Candidatus Omnitrophota bacterium]